MGGDDVLDNLLHSLGISRNESEPSTGNVRIGTSGACGRGLAATRLLQQGDVMLAVPLRCARTVSTSLTCLRSARKGVLGPVLDDLQAELAACACLLPGETQSVLLLALGLLAALRDSESAARPDLQLLPAPPGSPLAALCADGRPATDLLLFSMGELGELQCPPLEAVVMQERLRLASLHSRLFPGPQPAVSLHSFIWAHCLVRSRALSLLLPGGASGADRTGGSGRGGLQQLGLCMIPLLDLANHRSGAHATCNVRLRVRPGGNRHGHCGKLKPCALLWLWGPSALLELMHSTPASCCLPACSTVELVAARSIAEGGEVSISYGDRPLRDFLRGYAFTPSDCGVEVFEDFGSEHEALFVREAVLGYRAEEGFTSTDLHPRASGPASQHTAAGVSAEQHGGAAATAAIATADGSLACNSASLLLQDVRILADPGAHSLLDFGNAKICYTVGNLPQHGSQYGPGLVVDGTSAATGFQGTESAGRRRDGPPVEHDGGSNTTERAAAGLQGSNTLYELQHELSPARLDAGVEAPVCRHVATEAQALLSSFATSIQDDQALLDQAGPEPHITSGADADSAAAWLAWTHMQLAVRYRLARKHLLRRIASDLDYQASMVSDAQRDVV